MKTVSTLLVFMMLVSAFAVGGSAAQSIPGTSAAFEQCADTPSRGSGRCRSAMNVVAVADEVGAFSDASSAGAVGGSTEGTSQDQNLATPEFWRDIFTAILAELVKAAFDHFVGGEAPANLDAVARPTLFDPI